MSSLKEELAKHGLTAKHTEAPMQIQVEVIDRMGLATVAEYNHYVDFMNGAIAEMGGSISVAHNNACTAVYNKLFEKNVRMLPEEQFPEVTGDKTIAQDDKSDTTSTNAPSTKLEVHMTQNDIGATVISNMINAAKALPPEQRALLEQQIAQMQGQTPAPAPQFSAAEHIMLGQLGDINKHLAVMAEKNWKTDAKDVGKAALGAAIGVGVAYGVYAGVKYLFTPAV